MFYCSKYIKPVLLRPFIMIAFMLLYVIAVNAQVVATLKKDDATLHLNPILQAAFKEPLKPNPLLTQRIRPTFFELMFIQNFPCVAASHKKGINRRYEQSLGQQIASDIIEAAVNNMIYGNKSPVAVRPRF